MGVIRVEINPAFHKSQSPIILTWVSAVVAKVDQLNATMMHQVLKDLLIALILFNFDSSFTFCFWVVQ